MLDADDILNVDAYKALDQRLRAPGVPNVMEGVMKATKLAPGGEVIKRFMAASKGAGKLPMREFLYYQLWNPSVPAEELPRFVSYKLRPQHYLMCNEGAWFGPTHDKVVWDMILRAAGVPTPGLIAVFRCAKPATGVRVLDTSDGLQAFLRDPAHYPMIAKPNYGGRSLGVLGLQLVEGDTVQFIGGQQRMVAEVATFIQAFTDDGYLFQRLLPPDPRMSPVTGGALASCRVLVLLGDGGPVIENIVLKVPRTGVIADNYWRGNMLAGIDLDSGCITRAVSGSGFDLTVHDTHPDTGATLPGFTLPDFQALQDMALEAALQWPKITMQGWDIALTADGPVPIELNFSADVTLQQLAHGRGALTPAYCAHLKAQGWKKALPF